MLIRSIRLRNLLSFEPYAEAIELKPLNVIIGPNASGKSNLIEAIHVLRSGATDLAQSIREGGGIGRDCHGYSPKKAGTPSRSFLSLTPQTLKSLPHAAAFLTRLAQIG